MQCVHYPSTCLSVEIGQARLHPSSLDTNSWLVHTGSNVSSFPVSTQRWLNTYFHSWTKTWTKEDSKNKENDWSRRAYFDLRQVHNIVVTVLAAMFIVPYIGDIVGQVVQVHLWGKNSEQVNASICTWAKPLDSAELFLIIMSLTIPEHDTWGLQEISSLVRLCQNYKWLF